MDSEERADEIARLIREEEYRFERARKKHKRLLIGVIVLFIFSLALFIFLISVLGEKSSGGKLAPVFSVSADGRELNFFKSAVKTIDKIRPLC